MATNKRWQNYQSLGDIKGRRNTKSRIKELKILDHIDKNSTLLDIGCNRGMFCVALAPHMKSTTGVDPIPENINCGKKEATKRKLTNCKLINKSFVTNMFNDNQFNVILSLAVHAYLDMSMKEYANELFRLMKPNGTLVLESHQRGWPMDGGRKTWPTLVKLLDAKFERTNKYVIKDRPSNTSKHDRTVIHWRKNAI